MKNVILFIGVALLGCISVTAQEVNTIKSDTLNLQVDKLSTKLDKLQHDYNFFLCQSEQRHYKNVLTIFENELQLKILSIIINCYQNNFNIDLYTQYLDSYHSFIGLLDNYKVAIKTTSLLIDSTIATSNFSEAEIEVLRQGANILDRYVSNLDHVLNYYKQTLDVYKKLN